MPVNTYYRLDESQPLFGQLVHCFTSFAKFMHDVQNMRSSGVPDDVPGSEMKFWEVTGEFVRDDEGDAVVRVLSSKQVRI